LHSATVRAGGDEGLKYPNLYMLPDYLFEPDPLGIDRNKAKIGERMGWAQDHDND
jgi:hypothetical protein